jgi:hypothetical protein
MKTKNVTILLLAVAAICLLAASSVVSRQQSADKPDDSRLLAETYKKLYVTRLAADLAVQSLLVDKIKDGDYPSAKNLLLIRLKADLAIVGAETNYAWSDDQKKAQAMAEKCLKENENK